MKTKVALVVYRLNKGGAERVAALLSVFFFNQGLDVHNILVIDDVGYKYSGKIKNLGLLKNMTNGPFNKLKRLNALRHYLKEEQFDFIIDFRFRIKPIQELLISRLIYNTKTILTVHSSQLSSYMPNSKFLTKIIYDKVFKTVAVAKGIEEKIQNRYDLPNLTTIYNPVDIDYIQLRAKEPIDIGFEYVIGIGQYDSNVKQFDLLIEVYSKSILPNQNIHLIILGEGSMKEKLKNLSHDLGVGDKVHFLGYMDNPFPYLKKSKFFILSSALEGMPMVILESLACETPVVAFDCETGPAEIIKHGENGLLVKNQDRTDLLIQMNSFVNDKLLYNYCKKNTLPSIDKFSINEIGSHWMSLMNLMKT